MESEQRCDLSQVFSKNLFRFYILKNYCYVCCADSRPSVNIRGYPFCNLNSSYRSRASNYIKDHHITVLPFIGYQAGLSVGRWPTDFSSVTDRSPTVTDNLWSKIRNFTKVIILWQDFSITIGIVIFCDHKAMRVVKEHQNNYKISLKIAKKMPNMPKWVPK